MSARRTRSASVQVAPEAGSRAADRVAFVTLESVTGPAFEVVWSVARHGRVRPRGWCELTDDQLSGFQEFSIGPWPIGRLVAQLCAHRWLQCDRSVCAGRRLRLTRRAWFRIVLPHLRLERQAGRGRNLAEIPIDPDLSEREALLLRAYERAALDGTIYEPYGTVGRWPVLRDTSGRPWPKTEVDRLHRELRRRGLLAVAYHDHRGQPLPPKVFGDRSGPFAMRITWRTAEGQRRLARYAGRAFDGSNRERAT